MAGTRDEYYDQFVGSDWGHYLIRRIDVSKNRDLILAVLLDSKIKSEPLKKVVAFLKPFTDKYPITAEIFNRQQKPNKANFANQIIDFVKQTVPHLCLTCNTSYFPYIDNSDVEDTGEVSCFQCSVPAHATCIKKTSVDVERGIVYLCETCIKSKDKSDVIPTDETGKPAEKPEEDQPEDDTDSATSDSSDETATTSHPRSRSTDKKKKLVKKKSSPKPRQSAPHDSRQRDDRRYQHQDDYHLPSYQDRRDYHPPNHDRRQRQYHHRDRRHHTNSSQESENESGSGDSQSFRGNQRMCSFFKQGTCRYGVSGRSGGMCKFIHRKVCDAYRLYGEARHGCRKGDRCEFWHPKLCYKSQDSRECFNESCRFWHLKGTIRSRDNLAQQPERSQTGSQSLPQQHIPASHQQNPTNNGFLFQMKTQMNQELFQMKQQQTTLINQMNHQFQQMMQAFQRAQPQVVYTQAQLQQAQPPVQQQPQPAQPNPRY